MPEKSPSTRPVLLTVSLVLVGLQVLGLIVLAVGGLGGVLGAASLEQVTIVTLAVVLLGLALLVGAAGWGLWQGKRWGRGPVVTWQLLLLAVGVSGLGGQEWWATVIPIVMSLVIIAGVLVPSSRAATDRGGRPDAVL
ncbi:hypothetical protein ACO0LV_09055 [Pseudactinotalea sp. Z1739]|uniref:hypothetical protein n=1 Tax=Pseudactinotalea sp. Z1739 TaxID=3413028 RepID=UPI003C7E9078